MSYIDDGRTVLTKAEEELRSLIRNAAEAGNYEACLALTEWAKLLASLAPQPTECSIESSTPVDLSLHGQNTPPRKAKGKNKSYPRFYRSNNSLIKVAWSKSSKAEYEHRAPTQVLRSLAQALSRAAKRPGLITMDKVLPLCAPDGKEIPSYQAYLTLSYMKDAGLIRQHGRKGYSLESGFDLEQASKASFESLDAIP